MDAMLAADFRYITLCKRLDGLLAGDFDESWPGEWFYLLGAVWGAGGI